MTRTKVCNTKNRKARKICYLKALARSALYADARFKMSAKNSDIRWKRRPKCTANRAATTIATFRAIYRGGLCLISFFSTRVSSTRAVCHSTFGNDSTAKTNQANKKAAKSSLCGIARAYGLSTILARPNSRAMKSKRAIGSAKNANFKAKSSAGCGPNLNCAFS